MVFIAGSIMNGAQSSMPALAAGFYPPRARDRRGLDAGIGRFGGILGAFSGAFLMQAQLSFETIFTLLAIPAFLSAIALLVKYKVSKSTSGGQGREKLQKPDPPASGRALAFAAFSYLFTIIFLSALYYFSACYMPTRRDSLLANNHGKHSWPFSDYS
jgi:MFS family permease